jgi:ribosomal protein S18 acetylase RimI-like enzyme
VRKAKGEMTQVPIRPATAADLSTLGQLGKLLVALHHGFDPDRFIGPNPRTEHAYGSFLTSETERRQALVLVAEKAATVVGYVYAELERNDYMALRGPAGVIHDLVVDPGHRREGIGRKLLEAAIAELFKRGAPRVVLSAEKNETAQRLFSSSGFRRTMIEMTRELQ